MDAEGRSAEPFGHRLVSDPLVIGEDVVPLPLGEGTVAEGVLYALFVEIALDGVEVMAEVACDPRHGVGADSLEGRWKRAAS